MTPEDVEKLFDYIYFAGAAPRLDEAIASLSHWVSDRFDKLSTADLNVLAAIGSVLIEKSAELRQEDPCVAKAAANSLIDSLLRRK